MDLQLGLFGDEPATQPMTPVAAAEASPHTLAVAEKLPASLRLGTSSWSFPG